MPYSYDLTLGQPHTNHRFLSEHLLLKYAGHFQWQSIAAAAGLPLSTLRTIDGGEVYASFYYIEERIPDTSPLETFRLDDTVRFVIALRSFKNIAIEGRVVFDRVERLSGSTRHWLLMPPITNFRASASRTFSSAPPRATAACGYGGSITASCSPRIT